MQGFWPTSMHGIGASGVVFFDRKKMPLVSPLALPKGGVHACCSCRPPRYAVGAPTGIGMAAGEFHGASAALTASAALVASAAVAARAAASATLTASAALVASVAVAARRRSRSLRRCRRPQPLLPPPPFPPFSPPQSTSSQLLEPHHLTTSPQPPET